ncbi:MAG: RpiB/LacA/LacB family sugar-phosphate isomerase [Candidatus Gracilibacteria bacterium]|nr:RpiB/LacA/LacB family sugar-phosphate isomerase [bacterium]MDZ4217088.1 RpiB/LacA/LacB family sugar-phosphate isomerase [Candidatus Gracilibacteria bacterium]
MKIVLATDHAGYLHKEALKKHLLDEGYEVVDMGTNNEESCDYPDFIYPAAEAVAADPDQVKGVIFGGSGQGEAMTANRVHGVRATVFYGSVKGSEGEDIIELSRSHNNANILSIGARFVDLEEMKTVVGRWLKTPFSEEERHVRRIQKIDS